MSADLFDIDLWTLIQDPPAPSKPILEMPYLPSTSARVAAYFLLSLGCFFACASGALF